MFNLGPCPLPNGKMMFTSSRNGFAPNKSYTFPNLQLFVMDENGENVELIGHMNLGSALHPTVLMDGRVMFSSYEAQGLRDRRMWGLWTIWPDGRNWEPLMSALHAPSAFHWQTQLSDGMIVVEEYYNQNNNGFGTFLTLPPAAPPGTIPFGDPDPKHDSNPAIPSGWYSNGKIRYSRYAFSPQGLSGLTHFAHGRDHASNYGKVTQPSGAPNNDLLLVWSPGPANDLKRPENRPVYDAGLYLLAGGFSVSDPGDLLLIKNDPAFNEQQPRAVVPYLDIYGIAQPRPLPWLPNDGTQYSTLPAGTPYGLVGSSTFYRRNTTPGVGLDAFDGLDPFNTSQNGASTNWKSQGADAGRYDNGDIYAVRIVTLEPTSAQAYGPNGFKPDFHNHANERMRILGEVPLRKFTANGDPVTDPDGNPDTSFLVKIPADVPFTFQTLDKNGLVLNTSQTWHQVRPGEVRTDCGGCHAHAMAPLDFSATAAAQPDYPILDLANLTPLLSQTESDETTVVTETGGAVDVEYYQDIKPILQRSCVSCHSISGPAEADLVLDDTTLVDGYENTYHRLANDPDGDYGIPSLLGKWRQTNRSRYVRAFQSRRSLLIWKLFGERLDGWLNEDHPSASVPGDATTLPDGGSKNEINRSDVDFRGTICPPPNSGVPPLSADEKMLFARWIDLGAPISRPGPGLHWFVDELRPTLALSSPRAGGNTGPIDVIRIGMHDYYSGLNLSSLSVRADVEVNGAVPGTELAPLFVESGDHVWTLALDEPMTDFARGQLSVQISDHQGNMTTVKRTFSVGQSDAEPPSQHAPRIVDLKSNATDADTSAPGWQVHAGDSVIYSAAASDPDGDGLTWQWVYTVNGGPEMAFSSGSGAIQPINFTYADSEVGSTYRWTIRVSDGDHTVMASMVVQVIARPDTTTPSVPQGLTATSLSETSILLSWQPSTDNDRVSGYKVFHASRHIADVSSTSFSHSGLLPATSHTYQVLAYDPAGNRSALSAAVTARTRAPQPETVKVRLLARDQYGLAVAKARLFLHPLKQWHDDRAHVELKVGKTYRLRGELGNIKGPYHAFRIDASTTEIVVPYRTLDSMARNQHGSFVPGQISIYRFSGEVSSRPGSTLTLPEGAKIKIRAELGGIHGPWRDVTFNEALRDLGRQFWTVSSVIHADNGLPAEGTLHVYRFRNPISSTPGATLTLAKDAKVKIRWKSATLATPWKNVVFSEELTAIDDVL